MIVVPRLDSSHDWRGGLEAGPHYTPAIVPTAWQIISITVAILVQIALAICLSRVIAILRQWRKAPIALWLLMAIYVDSLLFAFASTILRFGIGVNNSLWTCRAAILICLLFYLSTKVLIYYYFVEKGYLVRGAQKPRLQTKLYLFNVVCALVPYVVLCGLNLAWRIHYIDKKGSCIIGMEKQVLWPLVSWEVLVNVYLTALFLGPLRELYSFKNRAQSKMRKIALRTFVGVCVTLTTSVVNLSVLTSLKGEQGWVCLLLCTSDVFVSAMVLHWVAMSDENRSDHGDPLPLRFNRVMTPQRRPSLLSSPSPAPGSAQAARTNDMLTPRGQYPWTVRSPVETTISSGYALDNASEVVDDCHFDGSKIHVKIKHEMLEENVREIKQSEAD